MSPFDVSYSVETRGFQSKHSLKEHSSSLTITHHTGSNVSIVTFAPHRADKLFLHCVFFFVYILYMVCILYVWSEETRAETGLLVFQQHYIHQSLHAFLKSSENKKGKIKKS